MMMVTMVTMTMRRYSSMGNVEYKSVRCDAPTETVINMLMMVMFFSHDLNSSHEYSQFIVFSNKAKSQKSRTNLDWDSTPSKTGGKCAVLFYYLGK